MQFELGPWFKKNHDVTITSRDLKELHFNDVSIGALRRGLTKLYNQGIINRTQNTRVRYGEYKYWYSRKN